MLVAALNAGFDEHLTRAENEMEKEWISPKSTEN